MKLSDKLNNMNACSEAVDWIGRRGSMTAWRDCKRADWMLWAANNLGIDRKLLVLAACDCAETALKYVPEDEDRPVKCIQITRNWCNGTASMDDVRTARHDAAAAIAADAADAAAAYAYAAAYAAYAAAYAADDAAAYAAYAAADAAYADAAYAAAADAAYARSMVLSQCADIVRNDYPNVDDLFKKGAAQ